MPTKTTKKPVAAKTSPAKKRGRPRKALISETPKKEAVVEIPKQPMPEDKTPVVPEESKPAVLKREKYIYAIGRRKSAVAKVRAFAASEEFNINKRVFGKYFQTKDLQKIVLSPLALLGLEKQLGFEVYVSGGGTHSQAEAVRHAIARILIERNPEDKRTLKKAGFLTRDPRVKERKKPGLKRARRGPQWAKR